MGWNIGSLSEDVIFKGIKSPAYFYLWYYRLAHLMQFELEGIINNQ